MLIEWIEQPRTMDRPCPVCGVGGAKRVRLAVDAPPPDRPRRHLLECSACRSSFYDDLDLPPYETRDAGAVPFKFYVEQNAGIDSMVEQLAQVDPTRVTRYLEIGCGFGFSLDYARFAYGWTVKGLDPSALAAAGRKLLDVDIDSAYLTPETDLGGGFDLVLCSEVIEHLSAPGELMRLLARALTERGTLILTTPNMRAVAKDTPSGVLHNVLFPGAHQILYSAQSLKRTLLQSGFTHVRVREREYSLYAVASRGPLQIRGRATLDRNVFRRYLGARAGGQHPDSPLAHGMHYRLFKELVNAGSYRKADLVFEILRDSYRRVYGIDLEKPSALTLETLTGLSFEEFSRRCPFNLCCVLFYQGLSEFVDRGDDRRALEYFHAAIRTGTAICAALQSAGFGDSETEGLIGQAHAHSILGLSHIAATAALEEFRRAGMTSSPKGGGAGLRALPAALLETTREELFVSLVNGGAATEAKSLLPELESASSGRWSRSAGPRVALARLALRSRFGGKLLPCSTLIQSVSRSLRLLNPNIHDYRADIKSLATRFADLASDPRRLAGMMLFLIKYPIIIGGAYLSFCRSLARRRTDFVEERWNGVQDLSSATKVAVFSHFDSRGVLHDFAAYYLRQVAEAGFTTIFVTNAPQISEATVEQLRPWCGLILRRANVGYDFGAYKDGICRIPDMRRVETLLLANDSVYGPFEPLKDILARMDRSADVWGITDSWERHHHHLQSYFLVFGSAALQSAGFTRFWARWRHVNSKYWIISRGEIGLSRALSAGGLRCRALFPYRTAAAALYQAMREGGSARIAEFEPVQQLFLRRLAGAINRDRPVNGTHYFWDYLISRQGCPFLKRELLRDNPVCVPFVREWEKVVGSASAYDTGLIARHLALTAQKRAVPDPIPPGRTYRPWFA